jgi:hypothetical protein
VLSEREGTLLVVSCWRLVALILTLMLIFCAFVGEETLTAGLRVGGILVYVTN